MRRLAVLVLGAVLASGVGADPARIFALNLFALPVDVQWGDPAVYTANGLFSRMAVKGALVDPGVPRAVLFKRAGQSAWSTAKGPDGKAVSVAVGSGEAWLLVVRTNGNGELVRVDAPATTAPKVLFVNAARGPAAQYRLGVSADGQEPGFGAFVDAVPGVQTLTWSWPTMPPGTDAYVASSAQPGQPGTTKLTEGHWYIAVISGSNGQVTDVTP
jgi:hypothetical protein